MYSVTKVCQYCFVEFSYQTYASWEKQGKGKYCSHICYGKSVKGTKASDETRAKLREAKRKTYLDPDYRIRRAAAVKSALNRPDVHKKRSDSIRRAYADPVRRQAKRDVALKPENAVARLAGARAMRADPQRKEAFSETVRAGMQAPGVVERLSASNKRYWQELPNEKKAAKRKLLDDIRVLATGGQRRTGIELAVAAVLDQMGIEYEAQKPIDRVVADIFIPSRNLILECDGDYWHNLPGAKRRDMRRDLWLKSQGYRVIRLAEKLINKDAYGVTLAALEK